MITDFPYFLYAISFLPIKEKDFSADRFFSSC